MPPRRQPDDEQAGVAARLQHALLARRGQQRLGRDAQDPLDGERAVREQAARVALALLRHRGGACEPERRAIGAREPRAELDRRPVVLGPSERDEHRALGRRVTGTSSATSHGRLLEEGGELLVGSSVGEELVGGVGEQELDVELGREASQFLARRRRRERGRAGHDTARFERGPALFEPRGRGPSSAASARAWPGSRREGGRRASGSATASSASTRVSSVSATRIDRSATSRPAEGAGDPRPSAGSWRRIARSSSWSAGLGSIPSSSTRARRASW